MRDLTQNVGNVLTIQHQTCVDEMLQCSIFVGYGGVIFFTGVPPYDVKVGFQVRITPLSVLYRTKTVP